MGRVPRYEEEGGVYHVIQRGNNREHVFGDDKDKDYLTGQLSLLCMSSVCQVYGFVIMGNHYHLILKTSTEPLQSIMHRLNLLYSKYYNRKYERSGHVFQGPYKAYLVRDESYILALVRYIHQNPVRAGICRKVEEYRWSSDIFYRENKNDWVETSLVPDILSDNRVNGLKKYAELMSEMECEDFKKPDAICYLENKTAESAIKKEKSRKSLDDILLSTGANEQDFNLIKNGSRQRYLTGYKLAYAEEALKFNYTMKAIGNNIKVSDVAIIDMLKNK